MPWLEQVLSKEQKALQDIQQFAAENTDKTCNRLFLKKVFAMFLDIGEDVSRFIEELEAGCGISSDMTLVIEQVHEVKQQLHTAVLRLIDNSFDPVVV